MPAFSPRVGLWQWWELGVKPLFQMSSVAIFVLRLSAKLGDQDFARW